MIEVQIKCPYCGHVHSPNYYYIDEEFNELQCGKCGRYFIAEAELNVITKKYFNNEGED